MTTASWILGVSAVACLLAAISLLREARRKRRALPRLVVTTGIVRELGSTTNYSNTGGRRSITSVQVDFVAEGQTFCCRQLYLFAGNSHVGDVGRKFDFPAGQEVGVHYDPSDPRLSALIIDQPRYHTAAIALILAFVFAALAFVQAREWSG